MLTVTDEKLIAALCKAIGKQPTKIMESCRLYHFYFEDTSYSYSKADIIKLLGCQ